MTDLTDMLAELIRSSLDDLALVAALEDREANMKLRRGRFEIRAQKKRDLVETIMERADIQKIAEADFTASMGAGRRKVMVIDERTIPERFWHPQPLKLDKKQVQQALETGGSAVVPGAMLSNPKPVLSVRTK